MKRAFVPEDDSMSTCGSRLRCEERLCNLDYFPSSAADYDYVCSPLLPAPPSPGADGPAALSSGASGVASASARAGPWAGAWPAGEAAQAYDTSPLLPELPECDAHGPVDPWATSAAVDISAGHPDAADSGCGGSGAGAAAGPPVSAVWEMIRSELDAQAHLEREEQQRRAHSMHGHCPCAYNAVACVPSPAPAAPFTCGGPGACAACRRAAWFGDGGDWAAPAGPCPGPRRLLVGWMSELAAAAALQPGTLFGAVSLMDRWVLGAQPPPPGLVLQLMGLAAVWVAGKVEEVYPLSPGQLLPLVRDAATGAQLYTPADLARAEVLLLAAPHIAWRARTPTPLDFLDLFLTAEEEEAVAGAVEEEEEGEEEVAACGPAAHEPSPSSPQPARAASPPAPGHGASWAAFACCVPTAPTPAAVCFMSHTATAAVCFADLRVRATQLLVRSLVAGGPALACRHPAALALDALGAAEGPGPAWGGARGGGGVVRALLARAAALGMPRERLAPGL